MIRFFNTFGPHQTTDFVISKFLGLAVNNDPITIYGDGSQTRTFCHVSDNIEATITTMNSNLFVNDVVNIGGADIITMLELAKLIIDITNSDSKIVFLPPLKDGDMTRRQPDNTKMKKILGRELIGLREGIQLLLDDSEFMKYIQTN